ncbi:MAG TPA: Nif11-like leader peptide family natural product precursor [Treponemataceae bacterium]|nr:Nif11-like leader peptide family natural product precursor [Treponemataceae bacterium]
MAMNDAMGFLAQCRTNPEFRRRLYDVQDGSIASATGYAFTDAEMEDALRAMQLRARDECDADEIRELAQWLKFMKAESDDRGADGQSDRPASNCTPAKCGSCSLCG